MHCIIWPYRAFWHRHGDGNVKGRTAAKSKEHYLWCNCVLLLTYFDVLIMPFYTSHLTYDSLHALCSMSTDLLGGRSQRSLRKINTLKKKSIKAIITVIVPQLRGVYAIWYMKSLIFNKYSNSLLRIISSTSVTHAVLNLTMKINYWILKLYYFYLN